MRKARWRLLYIVPEGRARSAVRSYGSLIASAGGGGGNSRPARAEQRVGRQPRAQQDPTGSTTTVSTRATGSAMLDMVAATPGVVVAPLRRERRSGDECLLQIRRRIENGPRTCVERSAGAAPPAGEHAGAQVWGLSVGKTPSAWPSFPQLRVSFACAYTPIGKRCARIDWGEAWRSRRPIAPSYAAM
jgi:hypothetical protein